MLSQSAIISQLAKVFINKGFAESIARQFAMEIFQTAMGKFMNTIMLPKNVSQETLEKNPEMLNNHFENIMDGENAEKNQSAFLKSIQDTLSEYVAKMKQ